MSFDKRPGIEVGEFPGLCFAQAHLPPARWTLGEVSPYLGSQQIPVVFKRVPGIVNQADRSLLSEFVFEEFGCIDVFAAVQTRVRALFLMETLMAQRSLDLRQTPPALDIEDASFGVKSALHRDDDVA
jgi:hypothetical protein